MAIKNNKDIPVGAIVTSTKGNTYLVLADDAGQRGLFSKSGTWMRFNGEGLSFGKKGDGEIKTIKAFDTLPPLDAISEGIKYLYTGRGLCAAMTTVYENEPDCVREARATLASAEKAVAAAKDIIARYERGW